MVGRELARRLDWGLFDTGIMYRSLTWLAFRERVELDDEVGLEALAHGAEIELRRGDDASNPDVQVMIGGENVTEHLRAPDVEAAVSTVAAVAGVRHELVKLQQRATVGGAFVVVGRDIGTVVLPDAPVKIFLTASDEVRARRRSEERGDVGLRTRRGGAGADAAARRARSDPIDLAAGRGGGRDRAGYERADACAGDRSGLRDRAGAAAAPGAFDAPGAFGDGALRRWLSWLHGWVQGSGSTAG